MLDQISTEIGTAMGLLGHRSIAGIGRHCLAQSHPRFGPAVSGGT